MWIHACLLGCILHLFFLNVTKIIYLSQMLSLCNRIGAPIKTEKVKGPTTRLTFLGIVLDTITMEASITTERKSTLLTAIYSFCIKKCTKCELLSLIGKQSFACKVVPAGCIFLRCLAVQSQNLIIIFVLLMRHV